MSDSIDLTAVLVARGFSPVAGDQSISWRKANVLVRVERASEHPSVTLHVYGSEPETSPIAWSAAFTWVPADVLAHLLAKVLP